MKVETNLHESNILKVLDRYFSISCKDERLENHITLSVKKYFNIRPEDELFKENT